MSFKSLITFAALLIAVKANAYDVTSSCELTPELWTITAPDTFGETNDLTRFTGGIETAKGQKITISGTVYDSNCVPLSDAMIYIWQPNYLGEYQNGTGDFSKYDRNFKGSGAFYTGNLGVYSFITIMPGVNENYAPHVNFLIKHKDFYDFQTRVFFENQAANERDPILKKYTADSNKNNVIAVIKADSLIGSQSKDYQAYRFDIVLGDKNKYKKY